MEDGDLDITPGALYQHYKGGRYRVAGTVTDATNAREGARVIVYESVDDGTRYCRDLTEFVETVLWPDGVMRPRFIRERSAT